MKKNIFLVTTLLLALCACTKNEVYESSHQIGFGTYIGTSIADKQNAGTRAAAGSVLSGTTFEAGSKIKLFAWNTGSSDFAMGAAAPAFMNGTVVTLSDTPATVPSVNYSPVKFWPGDGANNKLSFMAFYPDSWTGFDFSSADNVVTAPILVANDPAQQLDYMVSDLQENMVYSPETNGGKVALKFSHLMSQIGVAVKTDATTDSYLTAENEDERITITLDSLYFSQVLSNGLLTSTYQDGALSHRITINGGDLDKYDFSPAAPLNLAGTSADGAARRIPGGATTEALTDAFMLLPQKLIENTQSVTVVYRIQYPSRTEGVSGGEQANSVTVKKTIHLIEGSVKDWLQNQKILYTFTIALSPITFEPVFSNDWISIDVAPIKF